MKEFIIRSERDKAALVQRIQAAEVKKPLRVVVEPHRKNRSLAQNSLNWLWCDAVRRWLWDAGIGFRNAKGEAIRPYTSEEIHEWQKSLFIPTVAVEINGTAMPVRRSRNLRTAEFSEYLHQVDAYWADQGLTLPHPGDIYDEAMGR